MDEFEWRRKAVGGHRGGWTVQSVADTLGRTDRWVRQWTARADAVGAGQDRAQARSRAPKHSTTRTPDELRG